MWLNQWSMEIANLDAQDIRKADQESLMELFKYEVKPVTTNKDGKFIPAALDVIYQSLYRQKAIQAYGMKAEKPSPEQDEVAETLQATDEKTEIWIFDKLNYYNASGDALTNFEPEDKDQEFFKLTQYNYASETTIRSSETRNIDFQDHQREKAANTSLLQTE
jgi:hypothetical protein